MELDEFTFPTTNPNNSPIDSPPMWRLSPTASPTPPHKQPKTQDDQNVNILSRRKSCSFLEGRCLMKRSKLGGGGDTTNNNDFDDHDQEKMDMLWEDLNCEELFENNTNSSRRNKIEYHGKYNKGRNNEMIEYGYNGCVPKPFKLVRTSNIKSGSNNRKTNFLVLVKVLKRLFLLQQSAKKRSH